MFRKYHYLNTDLHQAAEQWIGTINGELVCHTGIIQFPMRKGWKRVHRLVVLPDYQGIGIGMSFINSVSGMYQKNGWNINLTTTTPSMIGALKKSPKWALMRFGRISMNHNQRLDKKKLQDSKSSKRITYSFNYKPT